MSGCLTVAMVMQQLELSNACIVGTMRKCFIEAMLGDYIYRSSTRNIVSFGETAKVLQGLQLTDIPGLERKTKIL